jgi:hypothetical protein
MVYLFFLLLRCGGSGVGKVWRISDGSGRPFFAHYQRLVQQTTLSDVTVKQQVLQLLVCLLPVRTQYVVSSIASDFSLIISIVNNDLQ